jgi:glycerol-3-phosphate acyltransferase PlsX
MSDKPAKVFRGKPNSSLVKGIEMIKTGEVDAFVSAGNTGAVLSTALFLLGRIEGVHRPGLAVYMQVHPNGLVVCDAGANSEVKPRHLYQFAIMSSLYMEHVHGVKNPRVGLLNIGEEATKGLDLYVKAYKLMNANLPFFKGNIESRYLLDDVVDVVICDGFIGNHILKFAEGWIAHISAQIERKIKEQITDKNEVNDIRRLFADVMREYDYEEYGGVPLLGVNGICVICHGSSSAKAFKSAIVSAKKSVEEYLVNSIRKGISKFMPPKRITRL